MTSPSKLKTTASHLKNVDDESLELFIEDAEFEVDTLKAPEKYREKLTRYLAIHLATITDKNVKSEKVGDLSRTYMDNGEQGLLSTSYGQEYQRLVDLIPGTSTKKSLNLTVI